MTKRELTALVIKLLGVYAIVQSLPLLGNISSFIGAPGYRDSEFFNPWIFIGLLMPFVLMMVAGIILLGYNWSLSFFIVKEDNDVKLSTILSSEDIQAIGFSIVAVLVFLTAIPRFFQFIMSLWYYATEHTGGIRGSTFVVVILRSGLSVVVQFGLSIILFFRARGLANLWRRIQVGKYVKIEDAEQNTPSEH